MKEDIVYSDTVLAVKSVMIGGAYLHRVRVWDKGTGELLVAMRMWSNTPYARGTFIKMQPDIPPAVAAILREEKEQRTISEVEGEAETREAEVAQEQEIHSLARQLIEGNKQYQFAAGELEERDGEVTRTGEGS